MEARAALPFTVIGGFLGAGKTTVLNHLLRHAAGQRIAVVVNDFGEVAIDADLIAEHDGDTITLTNGCICCSLSDEFALALPQLLGHHPPLDRVVVEASGISDPGAVAQYGTLPGFRLDATVVLADAETIRARAEDSRIGTQVRHQLARADLILITKPDLVSAEDLAAVRTWLAEQIGATPAVPVSHGRVPIEVLLGAAVAERQDPGHHHAWVVPEHHIGHGFETMTIRRDAPLPHDELEGWLRSLPEEVLRVKGPVWITDLSGTVRPALIHRVGRRLRITQQPHPGAALGPHHSTLVLVAIDGALSQLHLGRGWRPDQRLTP
jgi:G3E family GTPase